MVSCGSTCRVNLLGAVPAYHEHCQNLACTWPNYRDSTCKHNSSLCRSQTAALTGLVLYICRRQSHPVKFTHGREGSEAALQA